MSVPVIHTTRAELNAERFWAERIDPVAREHGIERPDQMERDRGDLEQHLLKTPDGTLILVVRTDAPKETA